MNDWMPTTSNSSNLYNSIQATSTVTGTFIWNGQPGFDTDDGNGSAPVREPRRPKPHAPAGAMALEVEPEFALA